MKTSHKLGATALIAIFLICFRKVAPALQYDPVYIQVTKATEKQAPTLPLAGVSYSLVYKENKESSQATENNNTCTQIANCALAYLQAKGARPGTGTEKSQITVQVTLGFINNVSDRAVVQVSNRSGVILSKAYDLGEDTALEGDFDKMVIPFARG